MRLASRRAWAAVWVAAALVLPACGGDQPEPGPHSFAYVVGTRANSPAPDITSLMSQLPDAFAQDTKISLYEVDGTASGRQLLDHTVAATGNSFESERAAAQVKALVRRSLEAAGAGAPEADTLGAVASAARAVRAAEGAKTLVVADNMLSTAGALRFQDRLLSATPEDIVASMDRAELPDLAGFDVIVLGAGQTAQPQEPLTEAQHKKLRAIWTLVFETAGAMSVEFATVAQADPQPRGLPPVQVVDLPAAAPVVVPDSCTQVLPESVVQFLPDTAQFLDPEAAQSVIAQVAAILAECPGSLEVVGTTSSWGTADGRESTSLARAEAVRDALADALGVDAGTIAASGAGMAFEGFVEDRDTAGGLVPELAAGNRTVRITAR